MWARARVSPHPPNPQCRSSCVPLCGLGVSSIVVRMFISINNGREVKLLIWPCCSVFMGFWTSNVDSSKSTSLWILGLCISSPSCWQTSCFLFIFPFFLKTHPVSGFKKKYLFLFIIWLHLVLAATHGIFTASGGSFTVVSRLSSCSAWTQ